MPIYPIIKLYWRPLLFLLIAIITFVVINFYGVNKYNQGVTDASATMQAKLNDLNTKQARQMAQASAQYQADKTQREAEQGVQYVEVERIVEKPIYLNVCLDDDGLSAINRATGH